MSISASRSAAAATVAVLAGCGSASTATQPSTSSLYRQLVTGYVSYARCARAHGMPNLPDPQVDEEGNDHYPALDRQGAWRWPESVLSGCATVWDRVHAIRDRYDSAHQQAPASPATYAKGLRIARCIRAHGFPTYPDPLPTGGFAVDAVPPGFTKPNLSPQARAAIDACNER
jgi:hypothetical protein